MRKILIQEFGDISELKKLFRIILSMFILLTFMILVLIRDISDICYCQDSML